MAIYNEILDGELNQLLVRRLGMHGGAPAPALFPEISPSLVLENDRPEWSFLKNERLFGICDLQVGAAGEQTVGTLFNPAGSGVLAVVTRVSMSHNVASRILLSIDNGINLGDFDTTHLPQPRDGRQPFGVSTGATLFVGSGDLVGGFNPPNPLHVFQPVAGGITEVYDQPIVLTPGTGLFWDTDTNNVQVRFGFAWRERRALGVELA